MNLPSTRELLHIWDIGSGRGHTGRASLMLEAAFPSHAPSDLTSLTVGQRDNLLFSLRQGLFGSYVEACTQCPECDSSLDVSLDIGDIRTSGGAVHDEPVHIELDGWKVVVRLPTGSDLDAIAACRSVAEARDRLVGLCTVSVKHGGHRLDASEMPVAVQDEIARALSLADPLALVALELSCAVCGHGWNTHFDIVEYLWTEMEQLGRRTLRDVHALATAYGWSEPDILNLSPQRRRLYLEIASNV